MFGEEFDKNGFSGLNASAKDSTNQVVRWDFFSERNIFCKYLPAKCIYSILVKH